MSRVSNSLSFFLIAPTPSQKENFFSIHELAVNSTQPLMDLMNKSGDLYSVSLCVCVLGDLSEKKTRFLCENR